MAVAEERRDMEAIVARLPSGHKLGLDHPRLGRLEERRLDQKHQLMYVLGNVSQINACLFLISAKDCIKIRWK